MADLLNRCIKCKCSLAAADKTSRLLPCLHTMCDDCVSGRTEVVEKSRRLKEEKVKDEQEKEVEEKSETKEQEEKDVSAADAQNSSESPKEEEESIQTIAEAAPTEEESLEKIQEEPSTKAAAPVQTPPDPVPLTGECTASHVYMEVPKRMTF